MDDHQNSPEFATALPLTADLNDPVRRRGEIKPKADEDWFRVPLKKGQWYWIGLSEIHFSGVPLLDVYRGQELIRTQRGFGTLFLRATRDSDYFVKVYQGNSAGGRYVVSASRFEGPNVLARAVSQRSGQATRFWDNGGLFGTEHAQAIQFFYDTGNTPFSISTSGQVYASDVLYEVKKPVADELMSQVGVVTMPAQTVNFYGRLKRGQDYQRWTRTTIAAFPNYGHALTDRWLKGSTITFSFDQVLPGYYDSDLYSDFRTMLEEQQHAVRLALKAWGEFINIEFREVASGNGSMRIGARYLDQPFEAFQRSSPWHRFANNTIEADIFVSNKLPSMQNLSEGSEGFYRLLQSVGVAIGLSHPQTVDQLLSAEFNHSMYTVMSNHNHPKFGDVYPSRPALFDILQIQKNYRASFPKGDATYTFSASGKWRGAIAAHAGRDIVSAAGHNRPAVIRLETGEFSYIGNEHQHFWVNANNSGDQPKFSTYLETAIGGPRGDRLVGSKEKNWLYGGPGKDILIGRQGNDLLNGGKGNDRYIWQLGDGSDVIYEPTGNGRDLLQIQSQWGLENFADHFSFRKAGKDLVINLDFENGTANQGSIRIKNMARRQSQVESLRVLGKDNSVIANRISLVSVWTKLNQNHTDRSVRFATSNQKDKFGFIVTEQV